MFYAPYLDAESALYVGHAAGRMGSVKWSPSPDYRPLDDQRQQLMDGGHSVNAGRELQTFPSSIIYHFAAKQFTVAFADVSHRQALFLVDRDVQAQSEW